MSASAQPTATREPGSFLLHVPITKVDKEKRLVSGPATAEVVDKQGEIVDYATAKKFFENPDLWPGNIREMHQPKAVGKKFEVAFDDDNKEIILTARVSKGAPDTWDKVLDGTLSMYSIGGSGTRVTEKTADGKIVKRLFLEQLAEVSLVDNGACPAAKFEVMKSVDGQLADAQPDEPAETAIAAEGTTVPVGTTTAVVDVTTVTADAGALKAVDIQDPFETVDAVRTAMQALARTPANRVAQKATILLAAIAKGPTFVAATNPVRKDFRGQSYDIDQALACISMLEHLLEWEAWNGADPDQLAQVTLLKGAIDLVLEFLRSEFEEQFVAEADPLGSVGGVEMSVKALGLVKAVGDFAAAFPALVQKKGARHSKSDLAMIQKMHDTTTALGATCTKDEDDSDDGGDDGDDKAANAGDVAKAAADDPAKRAAAKASEAAEAAPVEKAVDPPAAAAVVPTPATDDTQPPDTVQKLTTALADATKALQEQGDTIATLKAQVTGQAQKLDEFGKLARPGGPVARAVHGVTKTLGNEPAGDQELTPDVMVRALQKIADGSDESTRAVLAQQVVKLQTATGHNRIDLAVR